MIEEQQDMFKKEVVYVGSGSCGPCKQMKPILDKMKDEGLIVLHYIDIESSMSKARDLRVGNIPTLIEGDRRLVGGKTEKQIKEWLYND